MKYYTTGEFISNNILFEKKKSHYKSETLHNQWTYK